MKGRQGIDVTILYNGLPAFPSKRLVKTNLGDLASLYAEATDLYSCEHRLCQRMRRHGRCTRTAEQAFDLIEDGIRALLPEIDNERPSDPV